MHSHLLQAIGDIVLNDAIHDTYLRQAIFHHMPRATLQAAVKEAHTLRRPHGYVDFLDHHYSSMRQFAPPFLDTLSCTSHQDDPPLLAGLGCPSDRHA